MPIIIYNGSEKSRIGAIHSYYTVLLMGVATTLAMFVVQEHQRNNDGADDKRQYTEHALMEG